MPKKDYTEFKVTQTLTVVTPSNVSPEELGDFIHEKLADTAGEMSTERNLCVALSETKVERVADV